MLRDLKTNFNLNTHLHLSASLNDLFTPIALITSVVNNTMDDLTDIEHTRVKSEYKINEINAEKEAKIQVINAQADAQIRVNTSEIDLLHARTAYNNSRPLWSRVFG